MPMDIGAALISALAKTVTVRYVISSISPNCRICMTVIFSEY